MSDFGDHVPEMFPIRLLDDDTIDAITRGDDTPAGVDHLAAFACQVRAAGEGPVPRPSPALAHLFVHGSPGRPHTATAGETARRVRRVSPGRGRVAVAKVAGLGIAAKLGFGVTAAAASMAGAGVAGVLPDHADHAVRRAIEVVTPVEFGEHDDRDGEGDRGEFGDTVSSDATGESDGVRGVDGWEISREAPGAAHRPADSPATGAPQDPGAPADARRTVEPGTPAGGAQPPGAGASGEPADRRDDETGDTAPQPDVPPAAPAPQGGAGDGAPSP